MYTYKSEYATKKNKEKYISVTNKYFVLFILAHCIFSIDATYIKLKSLVLKTVNEAHKIFSIKT
ncbi:hypothetical protein KORDIASMS9_01417 [Kordia sp. SMS9]|nr:hypothetical protein KORDIASMS9_01417 [Kordia sp. SMS9]